MEEQTQAGHTPGKWFNTISLQVCVQINDVKIPIADCDMSNHFTLDEKVANAALIARAPELLTQVETLRAALKQILGDCDTKSDILSPQATVASIKFIAQTALESTNK